MIATMGGVGRLFVCVVWSCDAVTFTVVQYRAHSLEGFWHIQPASIHCLMFLFSVTFPICCHVWWVYLQIFLASSVSDHVCLTTYLYINNLSIDSSNDTFELYLPWLYFMLCILGAVLITLMWKIKWWVSKCDHYQILKHDVYTHNFEISCITDQAWLLVEVQYLTTWINMIFVR